MDTADLTSAIVGSKSGFLGSLMNLHFLLALLTSLTPYGVTNSLATPQVKSPPKVEKKTTMAISQPNDFEMVTPHYIRVNHPSGLVQLAKQVKGGAAERAHLEQLVGPRFAETLMNSNLDAVSSGGKRGDRTGPLTTRHELHRTLHLPVQLTPLDYYPSRILCDKMVPDVVQPAAQYVTSPIDGTITASVVPSTSNGNNATFWIAQIQSLTGIVKNGVEQIDQTSTSNTLPIKAGECCVVSLQLGGYVGTFTADLHLNCTGPAGNWSLVVPMKMVVSKANEQTVQIVGYNPQISAFRGQPFKVQFKVKAVNFRKPFFCFVSAPVGGGLAETTDPTLSQFYVKDNKEMLVSIPCTCASNAPIADYVDFTQMIRTDSGMHAVVFATVNVSPYQLAFRCKENLTCTYDPGIYVPFGSPGYFSQTWLNPEVIIDGTGHFAFLGQESDNSGNAWALNPSWVPGTGVWFVNHSQNLGTRNFGSYDKIVGTSNWIRNNWELIFTGQEKMVFYYALSTEAADFHGNLPPLNKQGEFTWPWKTPVTIHKW